MKEVKHSKVIMMYSQIGNIEQYGPSLFMDALFFNEVKVDLKLKY